MLPFPDHPNYRDSIFREGFDLAPPGSVSGWVLLFHGLTGTPDEMARLAQCLAQRGFYCRIPQLPGHAGDFATLRRTTTKAWLECVDQELLQLIDKFPHLPGSTVGLSFGSLLAFYAAARVPHQIAATVGLAPPLLLRSRQIELLFQFLSYLPDPALNLLPIRRKSVRAADYLAFHHHAYAAHALSAVARLVQIRRELLLLGPQVRCPALVFHDPADHHLDPAVLKLVSRHLPDSRVTERTIDGGQHELLIGHKHAIAESEIANFLAQRCGLKGENSKELKAAT